MTQATVRFLLHRMVEALPRKWGEEGQVAVCPSTGAAAIQVNGATIHSCLWCGLGDEEGWRRAVGDQRARQRVREVNVLRIDEVSMIAGGFLEAAAAFMKTIKQVDKPFGGSRLS